MPRLSNRISRENEASPSKNAREPRLLPLQVQVRHEARHEHQVDRPVADDLVGDVSVAALRVVRLGRRHAAGPPGASLSLRVWKERDPTGRTDKYRNENKPGHDLETTRVPLLARSRAPPPASLPERASARRRAPRRSLSPRCELPECRSTARSLGTRSERHPRGRWLALSLRKRIGGVGVRGGLSGLRCHSWARRASNARPKLHRRSGLVLMRSDPKSTDCSQTTRGGGRKGDATCRPRGPW